MEIRITVDCPDLVIAARTLANALNDLRFRATIAAADAPATPAGIPEEIREQLNAAQPEAPAESQQAAPTGTGAVPTYNPQTTAAPASQTPATAAPAPAGAVPTQAPTYTIDQLTRAAQPLMDAGRITELQNLLQGLGVVSLTALPQEQYGAFATALRGMGAQI